MSNQLIDRRKKEPWMVKGNRVKTSRGIGKLRVINDCVTADGVKRVLNVYVQLKGVKRAWPMSAHEVEAA